MAGDPSSRPRALFFCNFPPPLTGQTIGTQVTSELLAGDVEISRLDTSDGDLNLARGPAARLRRLRRLLAHSRELERRLCRERFDILYLVAAGGASGHLRDALAVRRARPRVGRIVAHVRSGQFRDNFARRWHAPLTGAFVRDVDLFILLSAGLSAELDPYLPPARRAVVANVIDPAVRVTDEEATAKVTARAGRSSFRVLYLGNMIPAKGYREVAAALSLLRDLAPLPVTADFAGGWLGPADRAAFLRLLADRGLTGAVRVHDSLADRSAVKRLLLAADAIVLPTRYRVEAQPRSLIEAMNAATPVVATRHASIPEFVVPGTNGLLIEEGSPERIAAALLELTDGTRWRRLAEGARGTYLERFHPEAVRQALLAAFLGTAAPGQRPAPGS